MSPFAGIGLKLVATFFFALMLALVKYAATLVPTGEVMFARGLFALIPLTIMTIMRGSIRDMLVTYHPWRHVVRGFVGVGGMFCWFTALGLIPLPEAMAISFAAPLMIVALAAIFLKEKVRIYRWTAVVIGLIGIMVILSPRLKASSGDIETFGVIMAVTSSLFFACASIMTRRLTTTEKNAAIVFYFSVSSTLFALASLYWGWVLPDWKLFGVLVLIGLLGGIGQILITQAFRLAEASLLAPFDYINMVWAILLGIFIFDEYPSTPVIVGGTIVIMAGLFVIYRENRLGLTQATYFKNKTH